MQGVIIEAMTTIQNILFPVDFSPSCVAMAANVKRAAAMFGAKVTLVHVFDLYSHDAFQLYVRPLSEVAEEQRNLARSRLEIGRAHVCTPVTVKSRMPSSACKKKKKNIDAFSFKKKKKPKKTKRNHKLDK